MKYTATFSTGKTITRTSKHAYTHAWMATWQKQGAQCVDYGFASSLELAQNAARPTLPCEIVRGMSAKDRQYAETVNAEFLTNCNLQVEIIAVKAQ